jgi:hypothetical protein
VRLASADSCACLRRQNRSLFRQRLLRILRAHLLRISHVSLHFTLHAKGLCYHDFIIAWAGLIF